MTLPGWFARFLAPQPAQEPLAVAPACSADPEPLEEAPEPFLAHPALDLAELYPEQLTASRPGYRCCWACGWPGGFCEKECRVRRANVEADAREARARIAQQASAA